MSESRRSFRESLRHIPKIADYPFTTLVPNLGVVRVGVRPGRRADATEFVMADIPGLIEGAAEGRGLGHDFLRHVERARVLCVLLDLSELAPFAPEEQLEILLGELGRYQADLVTRPRVVVGSKGDVAFYDADEITTISSVTGEGIDYSVLRLAALVVAARRAPGPGEHEVVVHKPIAEEITVRRERENAWAVEVDPRCERLRFQDLTDDEALAEIVRRLRGLGVDRC